jgi:hypothetical protein
MKKYMSSQLILSKVKVTSDCFILQKKCQGSCAPASYYAIAQKEEQSAGKVGEKEKEEEKEK